MASQTRFSAQIARDGTPLVSEGRSARSFFPRLVGLMGHAPLAPGEALLIDPCPSVHTHFMRFAIDVVYLDRENTVVGIDADLRPWRIGRFYRGAKYVIELSAGACAQAGLSVGDRIAFGE